MTDARTAQEPSSTAASTFPPPGRLLLWAAHLTAAGVVAWFAVGGLDYYLHPVSERARHPLYWQLKPGGSLGLRFGYAGAGMMTLLLLYSVRKRVRALRHFGPLRTWLNWHIFLGIHGPLFIVLHSSLKVGGLVAVSFWSMVAVAGSGVLGRFLYQQIPRRISGEALTRPELVARDEQLAADLAARWRLAPARVAGVLRLAEEGTRRTDGSLLLLLRLPLDPLRLRVRIGREVRSWTELPTAHRRRAVRAALEVARVHRRLRMLTGTRRLFRYWHVFHKPFAIVLYVLMIVHVAVAWATGYARFGA